MDSRGRPTAVHPHTRGDNVTGPFGVALAAGSPPHAWGQRLYRNRRGRVARFTPTRVGTTSPVSCRGCRRAVHPHTRGDNAGMALALRILSGSPPHAWG